MFLSLASGYKKYAAKASPSSNLLELFQNQYNPLFKSLVPASEFNYSPHSDTFDIEFWTFATFLSGFGDFGPYRVGGLERTFEQAVINPYFYILELDMTSQSMYQSLTCLSATSEGRSLRRHLLNGPFRYCNITVLACQPDTRWFMEGKGGIHRKLRCT